jgi:hypothetical protein
VLEDGQRERLAQLIEQGPGFFRGAWHEPWGYEGRGGRGYRARHWGSCACA